MIRILAWLLISASTTATVYNAVPEQCNGTPTITASGRIIAGDVEALRIIAMERTMMSKNGIHYGDTVLVKGTGKYDGEWVVEDTMGRRYAGQDKIDFLVPEDIKLGRWDNVEIYKKDDKRSDIQIPWLSLPLCPFH